jgi:hypothetical protein
MPVNYGSTGSGSATLLRTVTDTKMGNDIRPEFLNVVRTFVDVEPAGWRRTEKWTRTRRRRELERR